MKTKKFFSVLISAALLSIPIWTVFASPYLVCDPYPATVVQPDEFIILEGTVTVVSAAQILADGSRRLYYDVSGYSPGMHNLNVKARKHDPNYGPQDSVYVPFALSRPQNPTAPSGLRFE